MENSQSALGVASRAKYVTTPKSVDLSGEIGLNLLHISLLCACTTGKDKQNQAHVCQTCGVTGKNGHIIWCLLIWARATPKKWAQRKKKRKRGQAQNIKREGARNILLYHTRYDARYDTRYDSSSKEHYDLGVGGITCPAGSHGKRSLKRGYVECRVSHWDCTRRLRSCRRRQCKGDGVLLIPQVLLWDCYIHEQYVRRWR